MPRPPEISNHNLLRTMRTQAWERAKGELSCCLTTFWGEGEQYTKLHEKIKQFVTDVENEELQC